LLGIAGVALFGEPLLRWVFGGRFDVTAAVQVAGHWLWLTLALGPAILGNICAKAWQARGRAGLMSLLAGLGLAVLWLSHAILAKWLGAHAVAAAVGLSTVAVLGVGWRAAFRGAKPAQTATHLSGARFESGKFE